MAALPLVQTGFLQEPIRVDTKNSAQAGIRESPAEKGPGDRFAKHQSRLNGNISPRSAALIWRRRKQGGRAVLERGH